ncbi:DUF1028 domain-containing protein [Alteromonas oceanisediminis]|uniref:DUF1028 domain-containing protein n=1 Tax=Alteromonas oceanisediminis TaxID=2836180 RepID=UPI001BDA6946|nr:DUF1028 domain-containing protein [Alteromonas oceanisediminis]MBT0587578.1 DUF1028 domain-containing protein [Alteromonas oceanisediminis]
MTFSGVVNCIKWVAVTATMLLSFTTHATWSILAVDKQTGELGVAGASCTSDVSGIASIVPGKGAVVVQAASNYFARMKGVELMHTDQSLTHILNEMRVDKYSPEQQQIGLISLAEGAQPLVNSGDQIKDYSGHHVGEDVIVMGNLLVSPDVISDAYETFLNGRQAHFSARLMAALKAGEQAGGDKRCGSQAASSAFIWVYDPSVEGVVSLTIRGLAKGGKPAVSLLGEKLKALHAGPTSGQ